MIKQTFNTPRNIFLSDLKRTIRNFMAFIVQVGLQGQSRVKAGR